MKMIRSFLSFSGILSATIGFVVASFEFSRNAQIAVIGGVMMLIGLVLVIIGE
jgi:hypothetical protein